ncbi:MAG: hypothetical protein L0Y80_06470 [Ignavibacteriae bacterium]|nr:hypothetical protein [Ignavibacteriota bacterium]
MKTYFCYCYILLLTLVIVSCKSTVVQSDDIITRWEIHANNPVLEQTPAGFDANHFYLAEGKVLKVGSEYKMWYTGGTNYVFGDTQAVHLATSPDGINWTKAGPVVYRGQPGSWNNMGSLNCTVLYDDGIYRMWFEGHSSAQVHNGIGYATS